MTKCKKNDIIIIIVGHYTYYHNITFSVKIITLVLKKNYPPENVINSQWCYKVLNNRGQLYYNISQDIS